MKKTIAAILTLSLMMISITGCKPAAAAGFDSTKGITVISREDGSGTRGAFIELFGVEVKGDDGSKKDMTTKEAIIADKTDVTLSQVSGNEYAIGYVSVGSLSDKVKALKIDGTQPTVENIENGSYTVSRPFQIATKEGVSEVATDFIAFILSKEGQEVVGKSYVPVAKEAAAYTGSKPAGKVVVSGSSSVTPIMEKLREAYIAINTNATIEVQQTDSSAGMQAAIDGICDIGMASRELKDSEKEKLTPTQIAIDGIAVIVNKANTTEDMTSETIKSIYIGEKKTWVK